MGSGAIEVMPGVPTDNATATEGSARLGKLGHRYSYKGSEFKLVKNVSTTTALVQYAAQNWSDPAIGTATVTATTAGGTGTDSYLAGVAQSAIAAAGFGYICSGGITEGTSATAAGAAGDLITVEGTDGKFKQATVGTDHIVGHMVDAFASADTVYTVYLNPQ